MTTSKGTDPLPQWHADVAAMAGSLVHEIKNPLSTLKINTQLLIEEWRNAQEVRERRTVKRLNLMLTELKRLETIVNTFLSFTQRYELRREEGNVNELLDSLIELVAEAAEHKGVRIRSRLDPAVPDSPLDSNLLGQAFMNFFTNAQEAMPDGGELIITSQYDKPWIRIDFTDTGCGIPPKQLDRVFDLYFSTKKGGSGLGLARCLRIVQEHGGNIEVQSEVGKGSQFTVRLPDGKEPGAP